MIWACSTCRAMSSHGVRSASSRTPGQRKTRLLKIKEDILRITLENRVLRGGSFAVSASVLRSAFRHGIVPTYRSDGDVGLRPARTLPLGFSTALPPTPKAVENEKGALSTCPKAEVTTEKKPHDRTIPLVVVPRASIADHRRRWTRKALAEGRIARARGVRGLGRFSPWTGSGRFVRSLIAASATKGDKAASSSDREQTPTAL